jgi:hypothetical protein
MSAHLDSAARALREILARRHPEHVWTVRVDGDRDDARAVFTTATGERHRRSVADDRGSVGDRDLLAAPDRLDDDCGEETA